ncbi:MAG: hypothetical protein EAS48_10545 [Chryseobacterium sp.]|nr:MAG: hypothetical protein EAS48_10545 [Chryseobacterium sp.]
MKKMIAIAAIATLGMVSCKKDTTTTTDTTTMGTDTGMYNNNMDSMNTTMPPATVDTMGTGNGVNTGNEGNTGTTGHMPNNNTQPNNNNTNRP